jgi:hypothetical protein
MAYPLNGLPPDTQHTVWYSYAISVGANEIGSFERFSVNFSRTAERIREILFTHGAETKEIIWGGTDIELTISHVELYNTNVLKAFGFDIFTLEDLNQPLEIHEVQKFPTGALRTVTYLGCVATSMSKSVDTGTAKVIEEMSFACRTVVGSIQ